MKKIVIPILACVVIFFSANFLYSQRYHSNKQVVVHLKDGGFVRGWVVTNRKGRQSIVDLDGQSTELTNDDEIINIATLEKEFKKYSRDIRRKREDKTSEYLKLLDWTKERQLYELAHQLAPKIIRRNSSNPDPKVQQILEWSAKYLKLARSVKPPQNEGWTKEDVQKIRFALLPTDTVVKGIRINFRHNLIKKFIDDMKAQGVFTTNEQVRQFTNKSRIEQAQFIKKQTGNKYQPDIIIATDPPVMREFRRTVVPLLTRTCANAKCHGGNISEFKLFPNTANVVNMYANFYLLDTYKADQGRIINHQQPTASLLLQYLLPASQAAEGFTHPVKFKTPIRFKRDVKYQRILKWIESLPQDSIDVLLEEKSAQPPTTQNTQTQSQNTKSTN